MSFFQISFIILTIVFLSSGQILFKAASYKLEFSLNGISSFLNFNLIGALIIYFLATVMWLMVLKITPLRIAYPYMALAFVFVPLMSHYFLGENLQTNTFLGSALIIAGVFISSRG